ncbi:class I SAM-dependent methyltransferase [Thaumasiovibrio sp. DFM-14]|uniref:class I SAM-dependent methyltransferase n=1 Tax=Thaumasiovibrio sp. DFM-14 TaxID=3384792 RepID=UPI0039A25EE0
MSNLPSNTSCSFEMTVSEKTSRNMVHLFLNRISNAGLTLIEEGSGVYQFGDSNSEMQAQLIIRKPDFYVRVLRGGSVAAGEAYIDGDWDSPDLTAFIRVVVRNLPMLDQLEQRIGGALRIKNKIAHWLNRNNLVQAKKNISAHYDLGNDFYRQFLDSQMLYSSGIYLSKEDDLAQAQVNKMHRLCQQLQLEPDDHVLEIGTGWGAMAIYMAKHFGCRVTTTTISAEQYQWAEKRIAEEGVSDRVTLLLRDYRELDGIYDKLVSVEMIEAVGLSYLPEYIKQCQTLLKPGGLAVLQAITIADQRFDYYRQNVDFIQMYVFPGGFLPSVSQLQSSFTRHSDFVCRDLKDIGYDYARTVKDWHDGVNENSSAIRAQGFDERFMRLWRFYLSYCEGGFWERSISAIQLTLSRPKWV